MTEITAEDALRQAAALVSQALTETEARCTVLAQFINDREAERPKTPAWREALAELHALHAYRSRLLRRHSMIQQALEYPVGERPAMVPLPPPPDRTVPRTQQQVQVQIRARRRRS